MLSSRRRLREKQQSDVFDLRTGGPTAMGISACILEDKGDYDAILDGANDVTKTALARMCSSLRRRCRFKGREKLQSKDRFWLSRQSDISKAKIRRKLGDRLSLHPNED